MACLLLGIDVGTSSCKVTLFDEGGQPVSQAGSDFQVLRPHSGWAEQDPNEWWEGVASSVRTAIERSGADAGDIAGVGVDGQSWSAIPVDKGGEVLANTPIWMDMRAKEICAEVCARVGEQAIFDLCGNPFTPSYTTPKILWFRRERPEVYRKTHRILQSNSFIVLRLTGKFSHDMSQGYGLHFFDMRKCSLDSGMAAELGVDPDLIPPLFASHEVVGGVTPAAAALTGLTEGTPVVAGGLDASCGTLGAGVISHGQTQEQGGQAGGMSICVEDYRAEPRLILSPHVVPDRWLLQGGSVGGGGVLKWFDAEFGGAVCAASGGGIATFADMDREAAVVPAGSDGLVFLPYMSGERSPIWDERAKGVWFGIDYTKTRGHFIRACMEGVAYSLLHNLETALEAGAEVDELRSVGGGAKSALWSQIKADVTGRPVAVMSADMATSMGAAMLAGIGTGVYPGFAEAAEVFVKQGKRYEPDESRAENYGRGYRAYRALYEQLKGIMHGEIL
ncbi:MAG: FGGY-family carbohydrate kinase [Clostridiales Family XIII bacterium]|jgi:xylulokinase|nr:FGGY-family carbohydrate kinase [Clostridiales Family XIII bacterium]